MNGNAFLGRAGFMLGRNMVSFGYGGGALDQPTIEFVACLESPVRENAVLATKVRENVALTGKVREHVVLAGDVRENVALTSDVRENVALTGPIIDTCD